MLRLVPLGAHVSLVLWCVLVEVEPALAIDGAGVSRSTARPQQRQSVPYNVTISGQGLTEDLKARLGEVSALAARQKQGAADVAQLIVRARGDRSLIKAALYEAAHYAAEIRIMCDGLDVDDGRIFEHCGRTSAVIPVRIAVTPGPVFHLGPVVFRATRATAVHPPMTGEAYGLEQGDAARSRQILKAIDRVIEEWRVAGYPFARVARKSIEADHLTGTVSVNVDVDPGQAATYGWLTVTGSRQISPAMVARYSGLQPGARYSDTEIDKAGERLRKLEAIESVRVVPGSELDSSGGLPVTFIVTERKRRFIGASASLSTIDGGEVQAYWGHRNLFGRSEKLAVVGALSQIGSERFEDLQYDVSAKLTMPSILDIDTDLFTQFRAAKERPETYESRFIRLETGLKHRFGDRGSGTLAIVASRLDEDDAFGASRYELISVPAEFVDDARDDRLDPGEGWWLIAGVEPAYDFAGHDGFIAARATLSTYVAMRDDRSVVLAGRIGAQSLAGADIEKIPAHMRLFAGGSGSVRGYAYRSLGPQIDDEVVGGRGLIEGSVELRWRVSERLGLVAFFDAASVSRSSVPDLTDAFAGTGVGIRYYTSLGPIRLDLALPLDRKEANADFALYVGIGQAF